MALSVARVVSNLTDGILSSWSLHGHTEEILSASVHNNVCATSGADGLVLLWRVGETEPVHVCRLNTNGPAAVDVKWHGYSHVLVAQGDASATMWNVETGAVLHTFSRHKVKGRCTWPVVNCIETVSPINAVYGGDDGYVVLCDTRSGEVSSTMNLHTPISSIACDDESMYVGDACGEVHWYDMRMGYKQVESIQCASDAIMTIAVHTKFKQFFTYSRDGEVQAVDSQPFALSSADRLLSRASLHECERYSILRGGLSASRSALAIPDGTGDVVSLSTNDIGGGVQKVLFHGNDQRPSNVCAFVNDDYILCGGGTEVTLALI